MVDGRDDRRRRSYRAASRMTHERMRREAPLDAAALASVERSDVVVVRGIYDRVEQVLDALEVPHTVIEGAELRRRPEQLLVVNCPGELDRRAVDGIGGFVRHGGSLFTTDWALTRVIERAFPGTVAPPAMPGVEHESPGVGPSPGACVMRKCMYASGSRDVLTASRKLATPTGTSRHSAAVYPVLPPARE